ncbi:hypothetical protein [Veillonella magna]|uniref:Uncharacterized protein n=1 Tax=Veillonella magna TaxID=464322 RepID=A0ABS2GIN9_9FIRM|nr:hypothetical protein [Veillonella magna]MBM6825402.1 hypothetical protein [Veillonella magna]MBM6913702.1 hypothetical protein [Veillonella magna]
MEKIYLFTAVLGYIQIHIQLWEWYKDSNMRHKLNMLSRKVGRLTSWSVFICLVCSDLFITIAAVEEIAKSGNVQLLLSVLSLDGWENLYRIALWMVIFSMSWISLLCVYKTILLGRKPRNRDKRYIVYKVVVYSLLLIGVFLFLGYLDLGGDINFILDPIVWWSYKFLLFLGIIEH